MAKPPDEKIYVEIPFIEQLKGMGWDHIEDDIDVPYLTERESFRDLLLTGRLRKAIKKINLDDEGEPWLDDDRVNEVVSRLERISAPKLLEANEDEDFEQFNAGSHGDNQGFNPGMWLVSFFRKHISPVDGSKCPSFPTDSSYSIKAFKKHGFFIGWMM